jgi:excisionase family DNA binding protein
MALLPYAPRSPPTALAWKPLQDRLTTNVYLLEEVMEKRLLSTKELSQYLAMPLPTIYTYINTGKIPPDCIRRIGRAVKFERAAVDKWIDGGANSATTV